MAKKVDLSKFKIKNQKQLVPEKGKEPLSAQIKVNLRPSEKSKLEEIADVNVSAFVRRTLKEQGFI